MTAWCQAARMSCHTHEPQCTTTVDASWAKVEPYVVHPRRRIRVKRPSSELGIVRPRQATSSVVEGKVERSSADEIGCECRQHDVVRVRVPILDAPERRKRPSERRRWSVRSWTNSRVRHDRLTRTPVRKRRNERDAQRRQRRPCTARVGAGDGAIDITPRHRCPRGCTG